MDEDLIERLIERMDRSEKVRAAIRLHLRRQEGVPHGFVRLDDDRVVPIGEAAE